MQFFALPFRSLGWASVGRKAGFDAFSKPVVFSQTRWSVTRLLHPLDGKMADRILAGLIGHGSAC